MAWPSDLIDGADDGVLIDLVERTPRPHRSLPFT